MPCSNCGGAMEMVESNGETNPEKTRTELHECVNCGNQKHITLEPIKR